MQLVSRFAPPSLRHNDRAPPTKASSKAAMGLHTAPPLAQATVPSAKSLSAAIEHVFLHTAKPFSLAPTSAAPVITSRRAVTRSVAALQAAGAAVASKVAGKAKPAVAAKAVPAGKPAHSAKGTASSRPIVVAKPSRTVAAVNKLPASADSVMPGRSHLLLLLFCCRVFLFCLIP